MLHPGYDHFYYKTLQYHTGIQKMLFNHSIKQMNEKQYVQYIIPKKSNVS